MLVTVKIKGVLFGLLSGLLWGADTILNGAILGGKPFSAIAYGTILLAFFHDFFSACFLSVHLLVSGEYKGKLVVFKSKSLPFIIIAALFAGPIGMNAYLKAIETIGSGLTATISALYPAVAALLGMVFLKDTLTGKGWLGLTLSVFGIALIGYDQALRTNEMLLGFLMALVCVMGWSSESVIIAYGMKDDIPPKQALLVRQWTSSIAYFAILLFQKDFIKQQILTPLLPSVALIMVLALLGTLSYMCYYSAINTIGPVKATGLNVTYSLWAVLLSVIFLGSQLDVKLFLSALLIISGSVLVVKET